MNNKLSILIFMGFLNTCFGQNNEKQIYLAGWEARFNGDKQCYKFIETQCVDRTTAINIRSSIKLIFKNDQLIEVYDYRDGIGKLRKTDEEDKRLKYLDVKPHQIFELHQSENGKSYLGGEPPQEFIMPTIKIKVPFQYLGKLSKSEECFSLLNFDLHLFAPIYLDFEMLFIDYSNPLKPQIINKEELELGYSSFDMLNPNSKITYKKVYIKAAKSIDYGYELGHTGVPNWIQYPSIPVSPKNNKTMKFLCQLSSQDGVKVEKTDVQPKSDWDKHYFDHLNFWGDGDLFIFFEPESKVLCLFIQNT